MFSSPVLTRTFYDGIVFALAQWEITEKNNSAVLIASLFAFRTFLREHVLSHKQQPCIVTKQTFSVT